MLSSGPDPGQTINTLDNIPIGPGVGQKFERHRKSTGSLAFLLQHIDEIVEQGVVFEQTFSVLECGDTVGGH